MCCPSLLLLLDYKGERRLGKLNHTIELRFTTDFCLVEEIASRGRKRHMEMFLYFSAG